MRLNDPAQRRRTNVGPLEVAITTKTITITVTGGGALTANHIAQAAARLLRFRAELLAAEAFEKNSRFEQSFETAEREQQLSESA